MRLLPGSCPNGLLHPSIGPQTDRWMAGRTDGRTGARGRSRGAQGRFCSTSAASFGVIKRSTIKWFSYDEAFRF